MAAPVLQVRVAARLDEFRRNIAEGVAQIETTRSALSRMASGFDPAILIQRAGATVAAIQQVGGATMLTAEQQARATRTIDEGVAAYLRLGKDVPPGMQALADSMRAPEEKTSLLTSAVGRLTAAFTVASLIDRAVGALIGFGIEAFKSAAEVNNLALRTGLSTDTIQQMAFVADQTGSALESFTKAAFQLGVRLAGGKDSARDAVQSLGLEFSALAAMSPDAQFNTITAALERMESPQERNRLALVLFGQSAADIMPAIAQGYQGLAEAASLMSAATVAAADRFNNKWAESKTLIKALMAEMASFVWDARLPFTALAEAVGLMEKASAKARGDIVLSAPVYIDWAGQMGNVRAELEKLTPAQMRQIEIAQQLGATEEELIQEFGLTAEALKLLPDHYRAVTSAMDAHRKEAEALSRAYDKLNSDIANEKGLAQMEEAAAALRRQAENAVQLRLMERDAWQQSQAAQEAASVSELAGEEARIVANQAAIDAILKLPPAYTEAGDAATAASGAAMQGFIGVTQQVEMSADAIRAWIALMKFTAQANVILGENSLFTTQGQRERIANLSVPSFAEGVENFAGGLAKVHQGEVLVNLPRGTDVIPASGGGSQGITIVQNITVNGPMLGTQEALGRLVGKAALDAARAGGARFSGAGA